MYQDLKLAEEDKEILRSSISWITLLIASADGKVDADELAWAEKLTQIRSYTLPDNLQEFYKEVGASYQSKIDTLIAELPEGNEAQIDFLSNNLTQVNQVLAKLDNKAAYTFYKSFTSFAEHVAKSSGGFLRFFSVSAEEKKLIDLPMITPIILEQDPEA